MPLPKRKNLTKVSFDAKRMRNMRCTQETYPEHENRNLDQQCTRYVRSLECDQDCQARVRTTTLRFQMIRSLESEARLPLLNLREHDYLQQDATRTSSAEGGRIHELREEDVDEHRDSRLVEDRQEFTTIIEIEHDVIRELRPWSNKHMAGFTYSTNIDYAAFANIGRMSVVCPYCNALKWKVESKGQCCSSGKVKLAPLREPPEPLQSLLLGEHPHSKNFLKFIRSYNSAFQMTSFGGKEIGKGTFMPSYKIQGQIYHRIGSLLPLENADAKFLQIYFVSDYHEQCNRRMSIGKNLVRTVMIELQHLLHENNRYIIDFKTALQSLPVCHQNDYKIVIHADRRPANSHRGIYNVPTTNEVAVLLVNEECGKRDIVLHNRDGRLQRINSTNRAYDSLQYPLMFCFGEDGYHFELYQINPSTGEETTKKISALQFYSYYLMVRSTSTNYLVFFRQLLNQFLVDMYAKIEEERLLYIRMHQSRLRSESYIHLRDALREDTDPQNIGRLVILPTSFTGGPRYMHQRTQDAFVYVRKYGRPDLFLTITTNPKWLEISEELLHGQAPHDRHDILSRVFHLKLKKLMDLLTKHQIFGSVRCHLYTVEWQKRGLPHAHILLWLATKIQANQMDAIISAEMPDENSDPALFAIVKAHMIHGPCGALNTQSPCMKNGYCSKKYPKALTAVTVTDNNGYPTYRRRSVTDGGHTTTIRVKGQTVTVDNRWIVPYSPVLSRAFKTHINVEYCGSIQAIKYLCKYVNKGTDQATFAIQNGRDEVCNFQSGRYISTSEAVWRILSYPIHERFPPILHLDVHLENGQRIYFDPSNVQGQLDSPRSTTLTAFFKLNQDDPFAKSLLYEEVPAYYTFDKQRGRFNRRRRGTIVPGQPGIFKENSLGRVYTIHPRSNECYYLRLLLHVVRGPTSFQDLKTFEGVVYPTFQAACVAHHLLDSDEHWNLTLEDACIGQSARKLRQLFAIMLIFCNFSDAKGLWTKYKNFFSDDIRHRIRQRLPHTANIDDFCQEIENECLLNIQDIVMSNGGQTLNNYGLPTPIHTNIINRAYVSEVAYDTVALSRIVSESEPILSNEQRQVYEEVIKSVSENKANIFFLDAPGGTGKTFTLNLLLNKIRSEGKIALAVASSGIAATLLLGGKTAHSCFKIPLNVDIMETPVCDIPYNSDKATVFRRAALVVWDECTMAHKRAIEAVDRTLKDVRKDPRNMGGITFLFSGDFRQILPVVIRGTRANEIDACLKRSTLWTCFKKFSLTQNMRALLGGDPNALSFSNTLISIGEGTIVEENNEITLQASLCITVPTIDNLITSVYPDVSELNEKSDSWFCERAILAPKNDQVLSINNLILDMCNTTSRTYWSINTVVDEDDATSYPTEFLNSLNASGLPIHKLKLKVGVPIILLRNLNPPQLCNGTRLRVTNLQRNIVEAVILTGCGRGEEVLIPRIPLIPSNFPFRFRRLQFPVAVCFAMTVNKAQGQTLGTVGVDLRSPCFSHGQLYVACSRVSGCTNLYICAPNNKTINVVYPEALT